MTKTHSDDKGRHTVMTDTHIVRANTHTNSDDKHTIMTYTQPSSRPATAHSRLVFETHSWINQTGTKRSRRTTNFLVARAPQRLSCLKRPGKNKKERERKKAERSSNKRRRKGRKENKT